MSKLIKSLIVLVSLAPGLAAFGKSEDGGGPDRGDWICFARGVTRYGWPVGDTWQTVSDSGSSRFIAEDRALAACRNAGLQQCMVETCRR